ncbi:gene transfer agent family protein, partial [Methylopila musalis]
MPVNRRRGEVEAVFDGRPHRLVLTLGALAELEDAFGVADLVALAERFERGRLSARDAARILAAGLRGGGAE